MLSTKWFFPSQAELLADTPQQQHEPNESIAANGDGPSSVTIEGEWSSFLERVRNYADQEDCIISALKELNTGKGLCQEELQETESLVLY